jgi:hypothetical protein
MLPFAGFMSVVNGDVLIIAWEVVGSIVLRLVGSCVVIDLVAVKESLEF